MKKNYQDRIDNYLLHRMSDEERITFENEVKNDKDFQEQMSFTEDVQQILKSRNEKLAKMEEWQADYEWEEEQNSTAIEFRATGSGYDNFSTQSMDEFRSSPRSSGRKFIIFASGIAAIFVVGFFLIQNLYFVKSTDGYMPSPRMSDVTFRAGADNSDIELLLNQKKYYEALDMIEDKGLALKYDSLEIVKDITIDGAQKEYDLQIFKDKQDKLKWLKAHALLGLHHKEDALLLLDELRNTEGYYQMSADSLYNHIEK